MAKTYACSWVWRFSTSSFRLSTIATNSASKSFSRSRCSSVLRQSSTDIAARSSRFRRSYLRSRSLSCSLKLIWSQNFCNFSKFFHLQNVELHLPPQQRIFLVHQREPLSHQLILRLSFVSNHISAHDRPQLLLQLVRLLVDRLLLALQRVQLRLNVFRFFQLKFERLGRKFLIFSSLLTFTSVLGEIRSRMLKVCSGLLPLGGVVLAGLCSRGISSFGMVAL